MAEKSASDPYALTHYNKSPLPRSQGELDEREKEDENAIVENPNSAHNYFQMGLICEERGSLDEAMSNYQKAIQLDSEHSQARHNLANLYIKQAKYLLSIGERGWEELLDRASSVAGNNSDIYKTLAELYQKKGLDKKANMEIGKGKQN